jgi:hypothetical protein
VKPALDMEAGQLRKLESLVSSKNNGAKKKVASEFFGKKFETQFELSQYLVRGLEVNCKSCGTDVKHRVRKMSTALDVSLRGRGFYCSSKCANTDGVKKAKVEAAMLERYGVRNNIYRPEVRSAIRRFNRDKERKQASLEKSRATQLKKTGFTHHFNNPNVQASIARKSMFAKDITIEGKHFQYRGYEAKAIRHFLNLGVKVENIESCTVSKRSRIGYEYSLSGRSHHYIPDFIVKHRRVRYVVEVKSKYTAGLLDSSEQQRAVWRKTKTKSRAVSKEGDNFVLLVFGEKDDDPIMWATGPLSKRSLTKTDQ